MPSDLGDATEIFANVQPRLFGIAYRMLSSVADAEDIMQEVWMRWQSCDRDVVRDAVAYLVTTTTRMCINHMQSARARREIYVGPWLPERVDTSADPALGAERDEALQVAALLLLERLSPTERAAYVLREAFDYPYDLIGATIQVTEVNARQLVSRARRHLTAGRRKSSGGSDPGRLLTAFVTAAHTGDMTPLETVFAIEAAS
ncbi:MAG TPA: sigma-70 family RNA polymerase sigma factor [Mycobacterium sp.]|nr:sigma-70 family RNA polymerase sigma factor [Mycobacterium sp.]